MAGERRSGEPARIREWVSAPRPIELDVEKEGLLEADAVFSANTCHIMSWPQVERMFERIGRSRI